MPLIETKGAASAQGFGGIGGGSSGPVNYIEDVFSTYLYTGNGSTQTITNGIDLSTKGGMVWMKSRSAATDHALYDTVRGATKDLVSNSQAAETTQSTGLTSFASTGFSIGALAKINTNAATYVSWTFREQPKFYDVVTYTGNGSTTSRLINHSLASTPGFLIIKRTDSSSDWIVLARNSSGNYSLFGSNTGTGLQTDDGAGVQNNAGLAGFVTSSTFDCVFPGGYITTAPNVNGATYVAYLFAHNAGGFGLSGSDNVISCSSFDTDGSGNATVSLGYEPQFVMMKRMNTSSIGWSIFDSMRGWAVSGNEAQLRANASSAETSASNYGNPNATGFVATGLDASVTYMYLAIRRGPMKVPTSGTSVFGANARSGTGANATVTGGQIADAALIKNRGSAVGDLFASRLTGTGYLETSSTAAEVAAGTTILQANPWDVMDGVKVGTTSTITNASGNTFINYLFRRAPGFFDVVCYTGTGSARDINHNLSRSPELIILKNRGSSVNWFVMYSGTSYLILNNTNQSANGSGSFDLSLANSSTFYLGADGGQGYNGSSQTYVAYLFATCPGVSKVGSYTGTGATLQINCGFTGGARFVLIKRTDSTGDWYVWDSARGIVAGNDPYILLNSTAAEVTSTDYVDTYSAGFEISSTAPAAINANGGTFIFLAIA